MKLSQLLGYSTFITLLLINCAKPKPEFEKITIGMSEADAIAKLGKPSSMAQHGPTKYLEYESWDRDRWRGVNINYQIFYVRTIDGKVDSFGRKGDFDTTKNPTREIKIDQKIDSRTSTSDQSTNGKFDLKSELEKLDKLKKDGLLNDKEYQDLRQRLIDKAKVQ